MENSPDIVELSRKRLKSLLKDNSLKKSTIETIIGSFNSCTSLNDRNGIAARVSPPLRDELLQEVLRRIKCPEQFEKLARVIPFLLSSMTKTLDLNALDSVTSYDYVGLPYIDEVLFMAAQLAPNIERLFYTNGGILPNHKAARNYALFSLFVNNFRHLQILEMQKFTADLNDLVSLCGHLPSLRVVKFSSVRCEFPTSSGEEFSNSLRNLRLLVVEDMQISRQAIQITRHCVPNLDIVTNLKHTRLSFDDFLHPVGDPNLSQRKIVTFDRSWFEHPNAEIHERHPNIVHLLVKGDDAFDVGVANLLLPHFPNISSLSIETSYQDTKTFLMRLAERFLNHYGQNLRSFSLQLLGEPEDQEDYVFLNIEHIFNSCPNIESLSIEYSNGYTGPGYVADTPLLKEISWTGFYGNEPDFFLLPGVQKLELTHIYTTCLEDEAGRIATLIEKKQILQELEILRIDTTVDQTASGTMELYQMIKYASAFLPNLKDLKFSCNGSEYVDLARRMKTSESFKAKFISGITFDKDVKDVFVDDELIDALSLYQNYN